MSKCGRKSLLKKSISLRPFSECRKASSVMSESRRDLDDTTARIHPEILPSHHDRPFTIIPETSEFFTVSVCLRIMLAQKRLLSPDGFVVNQHDCRSRGPGYDAGASDIRAVGNCTDRYCNIRTTTQVEILKPAELRGRGSILDQDAGVAMYH
jgi:hypothetical protein